MLSDKQNTFLCFGEEQGPSQLFDLGDYRVGAFLQKNRSGKSQNEDVIFGLKNNSGFVLGVCDGAGGHPKGQDAAKLGAEQIIGNENLRDFDPMQSIERANQAVLSLKVGARTTMAYTWVENDNLRAYCVGDSEILYWNGAGTKLYSNIPHSTVGHRIEAGVVNQEASLDEPDRYIVTNMLGDENIRIEATSALPLKKGHTVIIGTDGLFDNISHENLNSIISGGVFENSFENLVNLCQQQKDWKKDDDIGLIMFRKIKADSE